jgi:hypothetical protein
MGNSVELEPLSWVLFPLHLDLVVAAAYQARAELYVLAPPLGVTTL